MKRVTTQRLLFSSQINRKHLGKHESLRQDLLAVHSWLGSLIERVRLVLLRVVLALVVVSVQPLLEDERIAVLKEVIGLPRVVRERGNVRLLLRLHKRNVVLTVGASISSSRVVHWLLRVAVHRASSTLGWWVELIVWVRGIIRERESREVVELLGRVIGKRKSLLLLLTETNVIFLRLVHSGLSKRYSGCNC